MPDKTLASETMPYNQIHGRGRQNEAIEAAPRVTVVVPTRNRAHYLERTIDSILSQDYPNLECIVVDAASTDGSLDLLRRYGERLRWLSEPDNGPFDAINKGWELGTGEIVAWLNADDVYEPRAITTAVAYLLDHPQADVVFGHCGLIDDDDFIASIVRAREYNVFEAVLHCDHVIMQSASFMRRAAVERVGMLYPSWAHDQELWVRIALTGGQLHAIPRHLANARVGDGHTHEIATVMIPARLAMTERIFALPDLPPRIRAVRKRAKSNAYLRAFDILEPRRLEDWPWGVRCLFGAIVTDPTNTPRVLFGIASKGNRRFPRVRAGVGLVVRTAAPLLVLAAFNALRGRRSTS